MWIDWWIHIEHSHAVTQMYVVYAVYTLTHSLHMHSLTYLLTHLPSHALVPGGSCPDDSPSTRRIDRFYHKEIILAAALTDTASSDDTAHRADKNTANSNDSAINCDTADSGSNGSGAGCWALLSVSGDVFLKGQVARLAGLMLGESGSV